MARGSGATWTTTPWGPGVSLSGGSGGEISGSSVNPLPNGARPTTVSAWIKMGASYPTGGAVFESHSGTASQSFTITLLQDSGTTYLFTDSVNAGNNITLSGSQIPPLNEWSHIAHVTDVTTYRYYLNGVLAKSGSIAVPLGTGAATTQWQVGTRYYGGFWAGTVADVKLWGHALTATEVAEDYADAWSLLRNRRASRPYVFSTTFRPAWAVRRPTVIGGGRL